MKTKILQDFQICISAPLMDTFLRTHKKFSNKFLQKHFQQATSVALQEMKIECFDIK